MSRLRATIRAVAGAFLLASCVRGDARVGQADADGPLVVFAAGSLARPLRAALDSFQVATGKAFSLELAGSLDLARRVTELHQVPDVIALSDEEVFPQLLVPRDAGWYARFARNRMVLARRPSLEGVGGVPWFARVTAPGVEVGRADPDVDPAGYRALLVFQLAERHYASPGLAARLLASAPRRNMRPRSVELVALLQAGELDYAWMYESSARGARLSFDTLPAAVDLGSQSDSATYASATARVMGTRPGDTLEVRGAPIHYGLSIPRAAPRPDAAQAFVRYLFSPAGQRVVRREFLDVLAEPRFVGEGVPPGLRPGSG